MRQVYFYNKMVVNMKGNGKMIKNKVMVGNCQLMDRNMKGIMYQENLMDKVNLFGLMEKYMKVNGIKDSRKAKVLNVI